MAASLASLSATVTDASHGRARLFLYHRGGHRHRLLSCPILSLSPLSSSVRHSGSSRRLFPKNSASRVSDSIVNVEGDLDDEACELVKGEEVSIGEENDYSVQAYFFKAVKNNNGTGLLLLSDVFGFEDSSTRDFAYRVACNGYNVLVPDLFRGDPWSKNHPRNTFEQWRARQDLKRVQQDIAICTKWMIDGFTDAEISYKLGLIGFCFGGGRVVDVLAKDRDGSFSTGVSFYGTRIDPAMASDINVPMLFITGDNDPLCQVDVLYDVEKKIGKGSKVVVFKGRGHAFAHRPESPEDDRDAEEAFGVMRNWLHDALLVSKSS